MQGYWVLKSEPDCYSIEDMRRDKTAFWDGVRNYQARNFIRDEMKEGDLCIFFHSSAVPPHAAGVCKIIKAASPDPTQFDPAADHFDADSDPAHPRWYGVDIAFESIFSHPVPLSEMKENPALRGMQLLARGNRLSVMPASRGEFETIVKMGS